MATNTEPMQGAQADYQNVLTRLPHGEITQCEIEKNTQYGTLKGYDITIQSGVMNGKTITLTEFDFHELESVSQGVESCKKLYVKTSDGGVLLTLSDSEDHPDNTSHITTHHHLPYDDETSMVGDVEEFAAELRITLTDEEKEHITRAFHVQPRTVEDLMSEGGEVRVFGEGLVWKPHAVHNQIERTIPESVRDIGRWEDHTLKHDLFDKYRIVDEWVAAYQTSSIHFGFKNTVSHE